MEIKMILPEIKAKEPNISDIENSVNSQKKNDNLKKMLDSQNFVKERKSKDIDFSKPIIVQNGLSLIFPNTINIIQGKKGQHKSRLAECFCSVLLAQNYEKPDFLNLKVNQEHNYTVCLIDTERNTKEQFPYAVQQILKRAGYSIEENPENFEYTSILDINREHRFVALEEFIILIKEKHMDSHIFIVLDVITDCVENFNDVSESLKLIDLMNNYINKHDVTFLCLIHENPSSEKGRGHLGTEMNNKASLVMQIGFEKDANNKETELIKLTFLHCRNIKRPETQFLEYSEEYKGLVFADVNTIEEIRGKKKLSAPIEDVVSFLKEEIKFPILKTELNKRAKEVFNCTPRTFTERIETLISSKYIFDISGKKFHLDKEQKGKNVSYIIKDVGEQSLFNNETTEPNQDNS